MKIGHRVKSCQKEGQGRLKDLDKVPNWKDMKIGYRVKSFQKEGQRKLEDQDINYNRNTRYGELKTVGKNM